MQDHSLHAVPSHTVSEMQVAAELAKIVGKDHVLDAQNGEFYFTDVYRKLAAPLAVIRPATVAELQQVVKLAAHYALSLVLRGGGASYTDGYLPQNEGQLLLDLSRLNQITEINETDGYVTVEAGVTWAMLKETLAKLDFRTPFWGPFSGLNATIGGSMSQNTLSHGSGSYGISAQNVLAMDIVLADGSLLKTGSAAAGSSPFCRHFGPDLTGLFTGDCGTLGIKARITLPLLRCRPAHQTISFAFNDFASMHESMRLIAQERLEDTHFALDGALSQGQIARQDKAGQLLKMAVSILKSSPSLWDGIKQLLASAVSARKVISNSPYMTHYIVEGVNNIEANSRVQRLRQLNLKLGQEIPATVPAVVRGMPFAPFYNTLGPAGERWVPVHGIIAHSKSVAFHQALTEFYAIRAADMQRLGIWYGGMFATVGSSGFLYEIALYWPDAISVYHQQMVPADYLEKLPVYPDNPQARAYIHQLKNDLIALFIQFGAVNFQLGKAYPYASRLSAPAAQLMHAIKMATDPDSRLCPGSLELS